jgi:hypothetical protein
MAGVREEETVTKLAMQVYRSVRDMKKVPQPFTDIFDELERDTRKIARPPVPRFKLKHGADYKKALASAQKEFRRSASTRVKKRANELRELVKTAPKYSNASFKCIADYDKCRLHRGDKGMICSLAFVLCMVKHGAALVNAAAKAANASMGG